MLEGRVYRPLPIDCGNDGRVRGYSPSLGLELRSEDRQLRFWDPATRECLPDPVEALEVLEALAAAEARAEQARRSAPTAPPAVSGVNADGSVQARPLEGGVLLHLFRDDAVGLPDQGLQLFQLTARGGCLQQGLPHVGGQG